MAQDHCRRRTRAVSDRAVADELEVRNVIARLAQLADDGDLDEYVSLFTADAEWLIPGNHRIGHDVIRSGAVERREQGVTGPGSGTRHVISTISVVVAGDEATAKSYYQYYGDTATKPTLRMMGHYQDRFVRTPDGWKLARREAFPG
ncbi:MAG: nuclear transport factor 2 family protein [Actinobacteria bacterium]|nr:MAG: nuclear transport factor 2 family protein [Actinomycetota bacterium]